MKSGLGTSLGGGFSNTAFRIPVGSRREGEITGAGTYKAYPDSRNIACLF
jgi:hypothetical protein